MGWRGITSGLAGGFDVAASEMPASRSFSGGEGRRTEVCEVELVKVLDVEGLVGRGVIPPVIVVVVVATVEPLNVRCLSLGGLFSYGREIVFLYGTEIGVCVVVDVLFVNHPVTRLESDAAGFPFVSDGPRRSEEIWDALFELKTMDCFVAGSDFTLWWIDRVRGSLPHGACALSAARLGHSLTNNDLDLSWIRGGSSCGGRTSMGCTIEKCGIKVLVIRTGTSEFSGRRSADPTGLRGTWKAACVDWQRRGLVLTCDRALGGAASVWRLSSSSWKDLNEGSLDN